MVDDESGITSGTKSLQISEDSFRLNSKSFSRTIDGKPTDFLITKYSNRIFIVATQIGKPGTLLEVRRQVVNNDESIVDYSIKVLLGLETEQAFTAGRVIAQSISSPLPILLSLGFQSINLQTMKEVALALGENF